MDASFYSFQDYKELVNHWISLQNSGGRGLYRQIAKALDVHPTFVSQVFRGVKDLSAEQAFLLGEFMSLTIHESDYFMLLVDFNRCGNHRLKKHLLKKLDLFRREAKELHARVSASNGLTMEEQAEFYSDWRYSALRHFLSLKITAPKTIDLLQLFNLTSERLTAIIDFLLRSKLLEKTKTGFSLGIRSTHLPRTSPHLARHHANWRLLAMNRQQNPRADDLFFTAVLSLSEKDALEFRQQLTSIISELAKRVEHSPAEAVYTFNIDWFNLV